MNNKMRVVWICHLSDNEIRSHLRFDRFTPKALARKLAGRTHVEDFAQWNFNAIKEFEKFDNVELHIVAPFLQISTIQEFTIRGVHYHFFPSEDDTLLEYIRRRLSGRIKTSYSVNTKTICNLIQSINPDIIHMIGAENPYYGESALVLPKDRPFIVSLQTLMSDPDFFANYSISKDQYDYHSGLERRIIRRADFIGSKVEKFRTIIMDEIDSDAKFLDMTLAVGEDVSLVECEKQYDFVYFAANISKAADSALEAFALAQRKHPNLTLHIVGGYDEHFYRSMISRIDELNVSNVDFTGMLPTHDDVLNEIRKAKYAILPLKIDLISGTIREAMANGLPVVTTITPATPKLNEMRQSVLLAEKMDFHGMANCMCKLLENQDFAHKVRDNAIETLNENYNNSEAMKDWVRAYKQLLEN